MRKLSDRERTYAKQILQGRMKVVNVVMNAFKIWGGLQIFAVVMYALFGGAPKTDIPFMLVGCVILYLVYFKLTGFLANKNQWQVLFKAIKKGTEYAWEGSLIRTYETRHGDNTGAEEFKAVMLLEDHEVSGTADRMLESMVPGNSVVMFSAYENPELGTKLVIAAMPD